jgi:biotin carboxyl carrier protein
MRIECEVAGKVLRIEVLPGQRIEAGEPLLLIECMKMEIPLVAPVSGSVREILVAEGDMVAEGQVAAMIQEAL